MTVRWGVLGCARVFRRRMLPAFQQAPNAEVLAVASRSADRAVAFAAEHGIARPYGSYEELLKDPEIEAVYIPLPNHLHAEWTVEALARGKHVLCDKPAALTYADAKRMAEAARAAGRRLMEGFMYRHHPQHARIAEIVQSGEIGAPAHFRGTFSYLAESYGGYRWDPAQGGGALFDVGVYPLNAARLHLGGEPDAVSAAAALDPAHGVDRHVAAVLEFAGGRTAVVEGGFDQTFTIRCEIVGAEGVVLSERAFQPGAGDVTLTIRRGDDIRTETVPGTDHYVHEIEHFSACVRDPARPLWPGEDGLAQMRAVEAVRRSLAGKRRVELAEITA
jgi:D-xylose 1-dehydrogenase (NADP+, D-xylono-1,5-lactone-forming)